MNVDGMKKQIGKAFGDYSVILCCSCFRMDKRAKEAFSLLFPAQPCPDIIKGRDRIYKFGQSLDLPHIIAISKLSGKFAYYIEIENNKITKEYDLLKGKRIG